MARIQTKPHTSNSYLQTCYSWSTTWTANPAFLTLLPHRPLVPALLSSLADFRFVGYRISRQLFSHKPRLMNAPRIGRCTCGCPRENPCYTDWESVHHFIQMCEEATRKLKFEMASLRHHKRRVDGILASCMVNLVGQQHPARLHGGSVTAALYAFAQWWRGVADEMVQNLQGLVEEVEVPAWGQVEVDEVIGMYSMDDAGVGVEDAAGSDGTQEEGRESQCGDEEDEEEEDDDDKTVIYRGTPPEEKDVREAKQHYNGKRLFQQDTEAQSADVPVVLDDFLRRRTARVERPFLTPERKRTRIDASAVWWK